MSATLTAPVEIRAQWTQALRRAVAVLALVVMLALAFAIGRATGDTGTSSKAPSITPSGPSVHGDTNRIGKAF
jgi:hypothetical protein